MLIDLREHGDAATGPSEVCIVGAGADGITLARRLAQLGHSVCMLESGGLDFEQRTQDLYRGENVGMTYYDLDQSRFRFFGGTTGIWGGRCALLDPIDFERRDWVAHSGWPINRTDLDPYYRIAHAQFELGEFNYEHEIWSALGIAPHAFDPDRLTARLWRFDELSERFGVSRCRDLFDAPGVRILLHANAVHLQAGPDARTIQHIVVRPLDGKAREVRARHYVLACGAIENARLLLASNDVEAKGIGNRHDQVGRYFLEHPCGRIGQVHTDRPFEMWDAFQKRFMPSGPPLAPVLRLGDATQRATRALNSVVTFKLQRSPKRGVPLGNKIYQNLKHGIAPNRRGRALEHTYRNVGAWFHREIRGAFEQLRVRRGKSGLYLIVRGEQAPNPDSRVRLSSERDGRGNFRANLDWQLSAADKHSANVFAQTFDSELRRLGLGTLQPSEWLASPDPQWPVDPTVGNHPIAGYHQMGTTRMSVDPAHGVVTADCNVFGYDNLFIAGSSVFSTSGWANPTLTLVALSLRLATHLDARLHAAPASLQSGDQSDTAAAAR
jgi:choline dehydrogenase-like flavoprotein